MIHLLDTTTFSALMRNYPLCRQRLDRVPPSDDVLICTITRGEIQFGIERMPQGRRRRTLTHDAQVFFSRIPCGAVPEAAGDAYARLKWQATRSGVAIVDNDLWIASTASTAMAIGATLVTVDQDFGRLQGLRVEDWTQ